jgi:hypothetical protein
MGVPTPSQIEYMRAHPSDDRRASLIIGNLVPLTFAAIAFILRFTSRRLGRVKIGGEDWLIMVGMVRGFTSIARTLIH